MFKDFLETLGPRARWGLAAGAAAIVLGTVGLATWLLRTDYQVLFADLKPQDAGQMVAELDRQKVPYQLADGGSTILVDDAVVHATRLKLMGKDMPLHGAAGFELFNNGDFGMTEFAQKINYQRALQGEITRTILSLSEVRDARVHLALPEEGLFKRSNMKPTAAITLSLKAGQALRPDQVNGIQRLVAAAVPRVVAQDVTIVDQQGVALTRLPTQDAETDTGAARLDLKRDMEKLLARKATEVLERAFGAGQAVATVDVTLNMDRVQVTTEDVVGTPSQGTRASTGVVVREKEVLRDVGTPLVGHDGGGRASNSQREVDYQVGRRVEQVITQPGAIRRIHVAAVVRQPLDPQQLEQARALLTAAVGGAGERGDTIVVQTTRAFEPAQDAGPPLPVETAVSAGMPTQPPVAAADTQNQVLVALGALVLLAAVGAVAWSYGRRGQPSRRVLSESERHAMAGQLRLWLEEASTSRDRLPGSAAPQGAHLPEGRA
ncbi:MAG TPA: flagellar basal-body MS-ring/collar protein FliF [Ramlibacter sp.]|nr:flagellar basal-body MS-ring/collar protein FliF [Ramlibacter sp.]